jgi:glycosyltransferase involved in cell wall biosynthesis
MYSDRPLVSIILPSYNHSRYLDECLESINSQSFKEIELIVIDDCSKDSSWNRINKWLSRKEIQDRFQNIVALKNDKNLGSVATLNKGIGVARGNLVTFINSDDVYYSDRIQHLVDNYDGSELYLSFGVVRGIYDESNQSDRILVAQVESIQDRYSALISMNMAIPFENVSVTTGNLFGTKELFLRLCGFRDLQYCHDWDLLARASNYCEVKLIEDAVYGYRLHESNTFRELEALAVAETKIVQSIFENLVPHNGSGSELTSWDISILPKSNPYSFDF